MGLDPLSWAVLGSAGIGAVSSGNASKRAASAVSGASDAATAEQRRQFDIATDLAQPGIQSGNAARDQLMKLLGLSVPQTQQVQRNRYGNQPISFDERFGEAIIRRFDRNDFDLRNRLRDDSPNTELRGPLGGYGGGASGTASADPMDVIRNTPGYQFQLEQGTRALNANRSAGGASGGELMKDFARFNQGVASNFYQDYANRLAGLAGSAQTQSANLGALGVQTGANIGNSLINAGNARASGVLGSNAAFQNVLQQFGQFGGAGGFGNLFGGGGGGSAPVSGASARPVI